jgi:hypothetical protein
VGVETGFIRNITEEPRWIDMIKYIRCHACNKIIGIFFRKNHTRAMGLLCWKCYKGYYDY